MFAEPRELDFDDTYRDIDQRLADGFALVDDSDQEDEQ